MSYLKQAYETAANCEKEEVQRVLDSSQFFF